MKILEFMSFSPSWFLTIPGIIITVGVALLLIATILFLASGDKEKKDETVDTTQSVQPEQITTPSQVNSVNPQSVEIPSVATVEINKPVETSNIPNIEINVTSAVEKPTVEPIAVTEPVQAPVLEIPSAQTSTETPQVSIYGGANPNDIYKTTPTEEKPTIYGGANPLENTAPIPRVEDKHEVYNFTPTKEEIKIVEPPINATPEPIVNETAVVNNGDTTVTSAAPTPVENNKSEIETLEF